MHLDKLAEGGFGITRIELDTRARVPGIDAGRVPAQIAEEAKQNCPVSKALAAVETIEVNAELVD